MRLEIRYLNEFRYEEPARESHNLLRACPANTEYQRMLSYHVDVDPAARVTWYTDYWGTRVDEFGIRAPHRVLRVCAEATVETSDPRTPTSDAPVGAFAARPAELAAYLTASPHAQPNAAISDLARDAIDGAASAVEAVAAVADTVSSTIAYRPGSTYVGVDVGDVLSAREGVCQDFAHLAIAMYRSVGIPARYVSGYLYATDQTEAVAPEQHELDVQTHAWLEAWVPDHGWWALDPTNPQPVGELHVKIGHGRDYEDVMPLRGVYHGGSEHELGVAVTISSDRLGTLADQ